MVSDVVGKKVIASDYALNEGDSLRSKIKQVASGRFGVTTAQTGHCSGIRAASRVDRRSQRGCECNGIVHRPLGGADDRAAHDHAVAQARHRGRLLGRRDAEADAEREVGRGAQTRDGRRQIVGQGILLAGHAETTD